MKSTYKYILFSLALIPTLTIANTQNQNASITMPATKQKTPEKPLDQKYLILEEQNKLIKEFQESILSTVYLSLGGVFGLAVLLAGFGWWSNFKIYEADKNRLQQELEALITLSLVSSKNELETSVSTQLQETLSLIRTEISDAKNNIIFERSELVNKLHHLRKLFDDNETKLKKIEKNIHFTEADMREIEEYIWELKGHLGLVLMTQVQGLFAAQLSEEPNLIRNIFSRMVKTLDNDIIRKNVKISLQETGAVSKALNAFETSNPAEVTEVRTLLSKVEVAS